MIAPHASLIVTQKLANGFEQIEKCSEILKCNPKTVSKKFRFKKVMFFTKILSVLPVKRR